MIVAHMVADSSARTKTGRSSMNNAPRDTPSSGAQRDFAVDAVNRSVFPWRYPIIGDEEKIKGKAG